MSVYTAAAIVVPHGISNTQGRFPVASVGGKYIQTSYYPQNKEEKKNTDHQNITGDLGPAGWHRKLRIRRRESDLLRWKLKEHYTICAELSHKEDRVKGSLHLLQNTHAGFRFSLIELIDLLLAKAKERSDTHPSVGHPWVHQAFQSFEVTLTFNIKWDGLKGEAQMPFLLSCTTPCQLL